MSSPRASPKSSPTAARKTRNDSPAPKSAAKGSGKQTPGVAVPKAAAAAVSPQSDEAGNICGLHPEAFRVLILGPIAVAAVVISMVFLDVGKKITEFVGHHWTTISVPLMAFILNHKDGIVMVALALIAAPLIVTFLVTILRAANDMTKLTLLQKVVIYTLVSVAVGLRGMTQASWKHHADTICSDKIEKTTDAHCLNSCLKNELCVAISVGKEDACRLCKSTATKESKNGKGVATYLMPEAVQEARKRAVEAVGIAEKRAKVLKDKADEASKRLEDHAKSLIEFATEARNHAVDFLGSSSEEKKHAFTQALENVKAAGASAVRTTEEKAAALRHKAVDAFHSAENNANAMFAKVEEALKHGAEKDKDKLKEADEKAKKAAALAKGHGNTLIAEAKSKGEALVADAKQASKAAKERGDKLVNDAKEHLTEFRDSAKDATIFHLTKLAARFHWENVSDPIEDWLETNADKLIAAAAICCMAPVIAAVAMFAVRALWGCRIQIVVDQDEPKDAATDRK